MIELSIPDAPPSLNKVLRLHWRARARLSKLWDEWVWVACVQGNVKRYAPFAKAALSIDRRGRKQLDPDNLVGSTKCLTDSLRRHGLILDDTPDHIQLIVTQCIGEPRTLIRIEELT